MSSGKNWVILKKNLHNLKNAPENSLGKARLIAKLKVRIGFVK